MWSSSIRALRRYHGGALPARPLASSASARTRRAACSLLPAAQRRVSRRATSRSRLAPHRGGGAASREQRSVDRAPREPSPPSWRASIVASIGHLPGDARAGPGTQHPRCGWTRRFREVQAARRVSRRRSPAVRRSVGADAPGMKQFPRLHLERSGELRHVHEADVALAPLNRTHIGAMKAGLVRQRFLRELGALPCGPQVVREELDERAGLRSNHCPPDLAT
jgi:hypothetical protein